MVPFPLLFPVTVTLLSVLDYHGVQKLAATCRLLHHLVGGWLPRRMLRICSTATKDVHHFFLISRYKMNFYVFQEITSDKTNHLRMENVFAVFRGETFHTVSETTGSQSGNFMIVPNLKVSRIVPNHKGSRIFLYDRIVLDGSPRLWFYRTLLAYYRDTKEGTYHDWTAIAARESLRSFSLQPHLTSQPDLRRLRFKMRIAERISEPARSRILSRAFLDCWTAWGNDSETVPDECKSLYARLLGYTDTTGSVKDVLSFLLTFADMANEDWF